MGYLLGRNNCPFCISLKYQANKHKFIPYRYFPVTSNIGNLNAIGCTYHNIKMHTNHSRP